MLCKDMIFVRKKQKKTDYLKIFLQKKRIFASLAHIATVSDNHLIKRILK